MVIGTTHFLNAIVEHDTRRLSKVAIIRLSKSFTKEIPPFSDFPPALKSIMHGYHGYVDGGLHIDGSEESPIVEEQVVRECQRIKETGLKVVVISGVFAPIDKHFCQEEQVRKIMLRELPGVDIVCSSEVSNIGFLQRENAAILNASILKFARRIIRGFKAAMKRLGLTCALFISQNDGTVIDAAGAARLPIKTFSSGPTNSMRGAAYLGLSQFNDKSKKQTSAIVVDVGGTSSDVGVLLPSGFPRQASAYVSVAGVTINFAMPHVESIGLGGGSIIREQGGKVQVGPDSVGYLLDTQAQVFGGSILTATDIAVAGGRDIGNPALVDHVTNDTVQKTYAKMKEMLENVIDKMKSSPDPLPVLLVGGGSIICPRELDGASELIIPKFHSVANAVGAAIARVGGSVDTVMSSAGTTVAALVAEVKEMATEKAIQAGAAPESIEIVEVDAIPLPYVADQVRVIVRAVGDLSPNKLFASKVDVEDDLEEDLESEVAKKAATFQAEEEASLDVMSYRPNVIRNQATGVPEWYVSETDIDWLKDGCYILGCAGGGSPKSEHIRLRDKLREGHRIRIIDQSALSEDARIYCEYHKAC